MTACTQPGCTGSIVDGYCDVCGSPGGSGGGSGSGSGSSAPNPANSALSAAAEGGRCAQPGCSGTIVDGYCDVCGTPGSAAGVGGSAAAPKPTNSAVSGGGGVGSGPIEEDATQATPMGHTPSTAAETATIETVPISSIGLERAGSAEKAYLHPEGSSRPTT